MSPVYPYHTYVRRDFNVICSKAPYLDAGAALQMEIKAVSDSAWPHSLI